MLVRAKLLLNVEQEAEDVVHDIFVAIWNKRHSITITKSVSKYLSAMLHYSSFRVMAENKKRKSISALSEYNNISDESTQAYLDYNLLQNELENAIGDLPDKCRLIFQLSREAGMTDKEIAQKLKVSVNTVRTQMYRALRKLKSSLSSFFIL